MSRIRVHRVGEQIKKEMSRIIQQDIKDPRIGFVTVTAVEMSSDLEIAKVYISVLGKDEEKQQSLFSLEKAKGYIRSEMGRRIQLRHIPEIVFIMDKTLEHSEHISKLLCELQTAELENE